jgi:hypothetical protein
MNYTSQQNPILIRYPVPEDGWGQMIANDDEIWDDAARWWIRITRERVPLTGVKVERKFWKGISIALGVMFILYGLLLIGGIE